MSEQQSIRDEISDLIEFTRTPMGGVLLGSRVQFESVADAILASPVIRRIQADALRDASDSLDRQFQDIPAWNEAYREGVRTDEWMRGGSRMVVSAIDVLLARADRIEIGEL